MNIHPSEGNFVLQHVPNGYHVRRLGPFHEVHTLTSVRTPCAYQNPPIISIHVSRTAEPNLPLSSIPREIHTDQPLAIPIRFSKLREKEEHPNFQFYPRSFPYIPTVPLLRHGSSHHLVFGGGGDSKAHPLQRLPPPDLGTVPAVASGIAAGQEV
ncbi:hypothetical protein TorRG33x02_220050 [Trema orientale]|uniref:Uncharacterized protein n=1 Tax=Trema orientale TaxID=63057 RepID=A0A2P5E9N5_TREOI|nr:hypothetical protein TorRG33x02_220050 [Trema orientale]